MTVLTIGRLGAVAISVTTFGFLFLRDNWRADNLFLVPDLVLCAVLAVAAALPARAAAPALLGAYAFTAGVLATSVSSFAVDGRVGYASLAGLVAATFMTLVLLRGRGARA
ncbi:hypothetical protein [Jidongwangia harbinensis]|uniref:hypothetical protein n=1 Tax=Jidongwangia harbinensis TaxID=2878561 RepID=UPI001CDA2D7E|nr:hypothetical protein [Jidongwangia harbinensis]MCA2217853.1 hypothetical protein [Jidongwangia harbinensis]